LQEADPMTKTVTSLFHSEQHATAAASHLEQDGIRRDRIDIWSTPHNLAPLLEDDGVSRADAQAFTEGVVRGGAVIIVTCDDAEVDHVVRVLNQEGALDLKEQQAAWRSEGEQETAAAESADNRSSRSAQAGTEADYDLIGPPDMNRASIDTDPTDQPDEVGHGRVRIQTHKVERPIEK
jgi:hypothetical protein